MKLIPREWKLLSFFLIFFLFIFFPTQGKKKKVELVTCEIGENFFTGKAKYGYVMGAIGALKPARKGRYSIGFFLQLCESLTTGRKHNPKRQDKYDSFPEKSPYREIVDYLRSKLGVKDVMEYEFDFKEYGKVYFFATYSELTGTIMAAVSNDFEPVLLVFDRSKMKWGVFKTGEQFQIPRKWVASGEVKGDQVIILKGTEQKINEKKVPEKPVKWEDLKPGMVIRIWYQWHEGNKNCIIQSLKKNNGDMYIKIKSLDGKKEDELKLKNTDDIMILAESFEEFNKK